VKFHHLSEHEAIISNQAHPGARGGGGVRERGRIIEGKGLGVECTIR
jgi:hypothetical protein